MRHQTTRDVLDRALNSVASIYRDVAVLQNNAEDAVGLINLETVPPSRNCRYGSTVRGPCAGWRTSPPCAAGSMATAIRFWCSKRCSAR